MLEPHLFDLGVVDAALSGAVDADTAAGAFFVDHVFEKTQITTRITR